jgi:hypothetical protein
MCSLFICMLRKSDAGWRRGCCTKQSIGGKRHHSRCLKPRQLRWQFAMRHRCASSTCQRMRNELMHMQNRDWFCGDSEECDQYCLKLNRSKEGAIVEEKSRDASILGAHLRQLLGSRIFFDTLCTVVAGVVATPNSACEHVNRAS